MTRLCFLDTETTGLDPDWHQVYEIGLVVRDPDFGPEREWRWWLPVDLGRADPNSLRVGQYFNRRPAENVERDVAVQWAPDSNGKREEPTVRVIADTLMNLTAGAHLVGAVPSFDAAFVGRLLRKHGCCPAWNHHLVDVEALAAGFLATKPKDYLDTWLPPQGAAPPWHSDTLSNAVGVDPDNFDRHTALGDARWARAIYDAVMADRGQP